MKPRGPPTPPIRTRPRILETDKRGGLPGSVPHLVGRGTSPGVDTSPHQDSVSTYCLWGVLGPERESFCLVGRTTGGSEGPIPLMSRSRGDTTLGSTPETSSSTVTGLSLTQGRDEGFSPVGGSLGLRLLRSVPLGPEVVSPERTVHDTTEEHGFWTDYPSTCRRSYSSLGGPYLRGPKGPADGDLHS